MKSRMKKMFAFGLTVCFLTGELNGYKPTVIKAQSTHTVSLGKGSYSTITKGKQIYSEQAGLVERISEQAWWPRRSVSGSVYVTENMKGAIPTNGWATSFLWGSMYGGVQNPYSEPAYAFPWAYQASKEGMYLTQPPVHMVKQLSGALDYGMPLQTGYIDFAVKPAAFTPRDCKVDKMTDWSLEVVMEEGDASMKTTMCQGSPYAFFDCKNTDLEVNFKRGTKLSLVQGEESTRTLVVKVLDNKENDWNYYALFAPEGVKWKFTGTRESITKITVNLPKGKTYMSMAVLPEESTRLVNEYEKYAFNFIEDTQASWYVNDDNGVVTTVYRIQCVNKETGYSGETLIGLLPHQWKNQPFGRPEDFLDSEYKTVRGNMKILKCYGAFETRLKYSNNLPFMPGVPAENKEQLADYVDRYIRETKNNPIPYLSLGEGTGDTYWTGKALNKLVQVLAASEQAGDEKAARILLNTLKSVLEDWFTTDDSEQDNYFYYDEEVGILVGYPSSFGSDTQLNDHHFHYGYWINAAAQVALRDPEWIKEENYGAMVKELVKDIANDNREDTTRYPYLRNFEPYEGHSWASGHQLFLDGNNQESSSEAIHAWAGIILLGETMKDSSMRDLGIYLYTTEISAVENYWFDYDRDVLSPQFRGADENATELNSENKDQQPIASMIWGGKYVYGTWWTAEPLQVQGINLLPITGSSLYLAKKEGFNSWNYETAKRLEERYTGPDKLADPTDRWKDVWSEYLALEDPEEALKNWCPSGNLQDVKETESGESLAHTYHYILSLSRYGRPDFSIQSDDALSAVFNKNGVKTYCAYNAREEERVVHFTDGTEVIVKPHTMYCGSGQAGVTSEPTISPTNIPEPTTTPEPTVTPEPTATCSETPTPSQTIAPPSNMSGNKGNFNSYSYVIMDSATTGKLVFSKEAEWVDVHIRYGEGTLENYRMAQDKDGWYKNLTNVPSGKITVFFTYYDKEKGYAMDTDACSLYLDENGNFVTPGQSPFVTSSPSEVPTSSPSPTVSETVSPIPSITTSNVKPVVTVTTTIGNAISQNYTIASEGSEPVELSKLTIRYYYDRTGDMAQNFWCDNAGMQLNKEPWYQAITNDVKASFHKGYVEIAFDSALKLETGAGVLTLTTRLAQADWSSYMGFKDNGIKVYYDGREIS